LAIRCNQLESCLTALGRYVEAEPYCRRALNLAERAFGPEHPETLTMLNNLARFLERTGHHAEAEPLHRRVLEIRERVLGPDHPHTLISFGNLGRLLEAGGQHAEAERCCRRALEGFERILGRDHAFTLTAVSIMADLLEKANRHDEARPLRLRCIQAVTAKPDTPPLGLRTAALDAYRLGDYPLANALLERVLAHGFERPGTHGHLARIALVTGDAGAARTHAAQAWAHRAEALPYVVPRILWLQLAARLLAGPETADPRSEPSVLLGRLKTALQTDGAQMEWSMDPVLDALKPLVSGEDHALLVDLVAALSDPDQVAGLDDLSAWREAVPMSLE
jgi:hypothetical protein